MAVKPCHMACNQLGYQVSPLIGNYEAAKYTLATSAGNVMQDKVGDSAREPARYTPSLDTCRSTELKMVKQTLE